jgi:glycosyltransferase involved in cell wall biosynthesis
LRLAAKVDNADLEYFKTTIEPMLDHPLIEFIGEINESDKCEFLGAARALLFPIDWPEPFGLVMIEAMSAGTPVIAWRNGSVPDVISNGVTGLIIDSVDDAVEAVATVSLMSRSSVRAEFERRFTAERMARSYIAAYRSLMARAPAKERNLASVIPLGVRKPLAAQAFDGISHCRADAQSFVDPLLAR